MNYIKFKDNLHLNFKYVTNLMYEVLYANVHLRTYINHKIIIINWVMEELNGKFIYWIVYLF